MKLVKLSFLIFIAAIIFASCSTIKKAQSPKYDKWADSTSTVIYNRIHKGYDDMSASSDRSYNTWQSFYVDNINDISVLAAYDSTRKHSDAITYIISIWKHRFEGYRDEHKIYNTLNSGQILNYQNGMTNIGKKVFLTESNYK